MRPLAQAETPTGVWEANPTGNKPRCGIAHKAPQTDGAGVNKAMNDMTSNQRKISSINTGDVNLANLTSLIKNPPQNSRVCEFTPELAEYILTNLNVNNRPRKSAKIILFKRDMQANNWSMTGETIKFGTDGNLKDGQNRLAACVQAQVPFTTHVIFGIDPNTFHHMDTGTSRNANDVLSIMGVKNANKMSNAIKYILSYRKGFTDTGRSITNQEVKDAYLNDLNVTKVEDSVKWAEKVYNQTRFPMGQLAASYYLCFCHSPERMEELEKFYSSMASQTGGVQSPQRRLQEFLVKRRGNMIKTTSHEYTVLLSRAIDCAFSGRRMTVPMLDVTQADKRVEWERSSA